MFLTAVPHTTIVTMYCIRFKHVWSAAAAFCFCAAMAPLGCNAKTPLGPVVFDTAGAVPAVDYSDLAAVLENSFVTKRDLQKYRLIDPEAAAESADRLDAQLKRLAVTGPTVTPKLFPTAEAKLAYWYNARAAWALKLAMLRKFPRHLTHDDFYARRFPLDGRQMTLKEIDEILAADSDWRTLVAGPCVTLQRACLPAEPFDAKDIRKRIAERLGEFIDDEKRFVISVGRKQVLVPPVLWRRRDMLIKTHEDASGTEGATLTTALLPYVTGSAHRRLQNAVGYRCVAAPGAHDVAIRDDD